MAGITASNEPANSAMIPAAPSQAPRNAATRRPPCRRQDQCRDQESPPAASEATNHSIEGSRTVWTTSATTSAGTMILFGTMWPHPAVTATSTRAGSESTRASTEMPNVVACITTFGISVEALVDSLACAVLVAVTVTDFERRIVPNRIIVPALVVALVVQTVRDP